MSRRQGTLRIGTSGYHYDHWTGVFYPPDLSKDKWFSQYASTFDTVEINNTFYHLPEATTFEAWRRQAPEGFCYALKFSRYGSHIVRLKKPRATIGKFLQRADRLEKFLGRILVQLPPNWKADPERLAGFLKVAPKDHRWAVEFRDPRWLCEAVFAILNENRCALCIPDMIENHPRLVTAGSTCAFTVTTIVAVTRPSSSPLAPRRFEPISPTDWTFLPISTTMLRDMPSKTQPTSNATSLSKNFSKCRANERSMPC